MWVSFGCFSSLDIYIWLVYGSVRIKRANTIRRVFKRDCSTSSDFINYSTPSSAHSCEDLCIQLRTSTNMHFWQSSLNQRGTDVQSSFCWSFILDLLMQHKFRCVNLISRSWRTLKTNRITPAYLSKIQQKHEYIILLTTGIESLH